MPLVDSLSPRRRSGEKGKGEGIPIAVSIRWRAPLRMNPEEHPTSNIEWQHFGVRCSMLDVRCFPSVQGFNARNILGKSLSGLLPARASLGEGASAMVVVSK